MFNSVMFLHPAIIEPTPSSVNPWRRPIKIKEISKILKKKKILFVEKTPRKRKDQY